MANQIQSILHRLERGDQVSLDTHRGLDPGPREFTVLYAGEELLQRDDDLYYRVRLRTRRGGNYVIQVDDKPSDADGEKGAHDTPELFYREKEKFNDWNDPYERTEGTVTYVKLEADAE